MGFSFFFGGDDTLPKKGAKQVQQEKKKPIVLKKPKPFVLVSKQEQEKEEKPTCTKCNHKLCDGTEQTARNRFHQEEHGGKNAIQRRLAKWKYNHRHA